VPVGKQELEASGPLLPSSLSTVADKYLHGLLWFVMNRVTDLDPLMRMKLLILLNDCYNYLLHLYKRALERQLVLLSSFRRSFCSICFKTSA